MCPKSWRPSPRSSLPAQGSWTPGRVVGLVDDLAAAEIWLHDVYRGLPAQSGLRTAVVDAADATLQAKGALERLLRHDALTRAGRGRLVVVPEQGAPGPPAVPSPE